MPTEPVSSCFFFEFCKIFHNCAKLCSSFFLFWLKYGLLRAENQRGRDRESDLLETSSRAGTQLNLNYMFALSSRQARWRPVAIITCNSTLIIHTGSNNNCAASEWYMSVLRIRHLGQTLREMKATNCSRGRHNLKLSLNRLQHHNPTPNSCHFLLFLTTFYLWFLLFFLLIRSVGFLISDFMPLHVGYHFQWIFFHDIYDLFAGTMRQLWARALLDFRFFFRLAPFFWPALFLFCQQSK